MSTFYFIFFGAGFALAPDPKTQGQSDNPHRKPRHSSCFRSPATEARFHPRTEPRIRHRFRLSRMRRRILSRYSRTTLFQGFLMNDGCGRSAGRSSRRTRGFHAITEAQMLAVLEGKSCTTIPTTAFHDIDHSAGKLRAIILCDCVHGANGRITKENLHVFHFRLAFLESEYNIFGSECQPFIFFCLARDLL